MGVVARWKEGRRVHDLCERFRKGMAAAGEHKQAALDDTAILVGYKNLILEQPESRGRTTEEIEVAVMRALEATVWAMENPI